MAHCDEAHKLELAADLYRRRFITRLYCAESLAESPCVAVVARHLNKGTMATTSYCTDYLVASY